MKGKALFSGVLVLLMGVLTMAPAAHAMWVNLTPEQADKAQKVGGFNASNANPRAFMKPWVVNLGDSNGTALIMTEFLSLAFAAQEAARNMAALQPWEMEDALARARGKLVFSVTTFDKTPDYADRLRGWVIAPDGRKIQNTHWQNGKAEPYEGGLYVADSTFWFSSEGIDPESKITLLIQDSQTGREWRFPFDLSQVR